MRLTAQFLLLASAAFLLYGCASPSPPHSSKPTPSSSDPAWTWIDSGHYRVQFSPLTTVHNTGLQLPVASPDGQWVAALDCINSLALDPDAALTGKTLSDVSLVLYNTTSAQSQPRLIAHAAAWPVWSPDSKRLLAVTYDRNNHCGLIDHDLATGQTRRMEIGLPHIVTPALSPNGKILALTAFSETTQQSRLYIYDLTRQRLTPLPPPKDTIWQILPMWINDDALLYYARINADTALLGASTDASKPHSLLAKIALSPEASEAIRLQGGILHPLAPGAQWLALLDAPSNRIVLHKLDESRSWPLDSSSQAGCWAGPADSPRFLYATDQKLLITRPADASHLLTATPSLPIWCDPNGSSLLILAPGQKDWTLQLVRMLITRAP